MDDLTEGLTEETVEEPIVVPASATPQLAVTLVRYLMVALGGYLLSRGVVSETTRDLLLSPEVINGVVGFVVIAAPTVFGLLRNKRNVAVQQKLESKLPDSIATRA